MLYVIYLWYIPPIRSKSPGRSVRNNSGQSGKHSFSPGLLVNSFRWFVLVFGLIVLVSVAVVGVLVT